MSRATFYLLHLKISIILLGARMWGWLTGWEWEFVSVLGRGGGCDAESEAGPYSLGHINQ